MPSWNFAAAVVTVVLRGLVERIFAATPIVKSPSIPPSTCLLLLSGTLYLLYNRLVKGRTIQAINPSVNHRKILDGRLHKKDSSSSSASSVRPSCSTRRSRRRSISKCKNNLLQTTKESLEMLHGNVTSSPLYTKSACSVKCHRKDSSVPKTEMKECSANVCSIKSEGEGGKKDEKRIDDPENGFKESCQKQECQKTMKGRKTIGATRKTRSGKNYSSY